MTSNNRSRTASFNWSAWAFSVAVGGTGLGVLLYVDWTVALGVFLLIWCNNVQQDINSQTESGENNG